MANFLIGFFSRRQVFHIVAYRDTPEEVEAFLKTHNKRGLVVYAAQQSVQPTLLTLCPECGVEQIVTHLPTCAHYVAQSG